MEGSHELLSMSCQKWTSKLIKPLSDDVIEYLHFLFNLSESKCQKYGKQDKNSLYAMFQQYCLGVKDISYEDIDLKVNALEKKGKNNIITF